jgi:protein SMG7
MAEFRLACMTVIFHDFEYAVAKKVEHSLWQCHTFLNGEYRKALGRLNTPNQVVQRRKLDKLYRGFLKTSEQFYFVYIQQLSNRFSIPELQQIARKTKTQPIEQRGENVSPPTPLRAMVLKSCQMTLVRLGDLTRYRCQLSDKFSKTTFDTALDYYGLANSLDPEDGSAHHQLAVLHQLPGQHFDIVYHFHRAIAVSRPHELALKNLEREFKSPETSSQTKKGPSKDQSQAMVTWFVRLQAFFSHGKHFTQQPELEEEVLHRFELALKNESPAGNLLLKMILVNIAAYDISTEKVKSSWTMEGSQSCQFLLRFNTRMMLVLFRVLDHTLRDDTVAAVASTTGAKSGESCIAFAPSLTKLLPLCRLYIAWSYVVRADLVQYQEYLEHYIKDLYRLLADVLTSLNLYIDPTMETVSSKYLLPEDIEAQGLRPLGDRRLPLFLQTEEQPDSNPPKRAKARKPQQDVFGRQFNQDTEAVWRIRDIVCCGAFLAGSAKFPIALATRAEDGRDIETWVFTDGASAQPPSNESLLSQILVKLQFGDIKNGPENSVEPATNNAPNQDPENRTIPSPENLPKVRVSSLNDESNKSKGKGKDLKKPSKNYPESDLSEDSEMINMVNRLLDPSDGIRPRSSQAQTEPSHGMHSSTANEIFGNIEINPIQPSPVSKTIPSLPWDYFYTPTPHRSSSQDHNELSSNGHNIPRSAAGQFSGFGSSSYLDNLGVPYQAQPNSLSPRVTTSYLQNSPRPTTSSPGLPRTDYGLDTLEDSRSAVLDSLRSALLVQHGLFPSSPSPSNFQNRTSMTPVGSVQPPEYGHNSNSYLSSPAGRQASLASLPNPLVPPGRGRPELGQAPPTISGNHFPTTTRPMNNSIETTPNIWSQGSSGLRQQHPAWPHESSTTASPVFSHPSSLITGTPSAAPAPLAPVANAVACNGHYYNATTPFDRLGDGVNNRADPTHFRNQLKATVGTAEIPYDQQILQAAMMDNNRKPRPK